MLNSGRRGRRAPDGYGIQSVNEKFNQANYPIPIINSWSITDGSYNPTSITALSTAGGETVVVYGSGFTAGVTVNINGTNISPVTLLDQGRITFTSPALASASYTMYVANTDGATAIYVPGLVYSGVPNWSSPAAGSIGSSYETKSVNTLTSNTFISTGDAPLTYAIVSGNLPSGVTLSSSGVLSGSLPATSSATTYSFTIRAYDAQMQTSDRSFSLTINPDVVTWVAPTQNGSLTVYETKPFSTPLSATSAAGYGVLYTSNTLPTGITLSTDTGVLNGYANTVGTTNAQLTATANTTGRYALSNVLFTVTQDSVTWSAPANNTSYSLSSGIAMSAVTLSASSAAGYGVQYTANSLPTGVSISGSSITGTPTVTGTSTSQITATANTTNRVSYVYINWSVSIAGDTYWANTTTLLTANSTFQSPSFLTDFSNNNIQSTFSGDTRPSLFNPYSGNYYSTYYGVKTDYLSVPATTKLTTFTGDFTIEAWVYPTDTSITYWGIYDARENGQTANAIVFSIVPLASAVTGQGRLSYYNGTSYYGTGIVYFNQWSHVAIVRSGSTLTYYINGVAGGTSSISGTQTGTASVNPVYIGSKDSALGGYGNVGYISNFRIVNGTAVYNSNFTPSTTPLTAVANTVLLTCQSNRFVDNSLNNYTITKSTSTSANSANPFGMVTTSSYNNLYSTYFDGTGDYLTVPQSSALALSTGDFTIEFWFYSTSATAAIIDLRNTVSQVAPFIVMLTQTMRWYVSGGYQITSSSVALNTWNHLAVVRSSGTTTMYLNGTQTGSTYADTNNYISNTTYIGGAYNSSQMTTGYISNLRVIKGQALYTGNFTPATGTLTTSVVGTSGANVAASITGTVSLLTCQNNTLIDNSTNAFTITSAGDARPVAVSPFTMTTANNTMTTIGSTYFDGTGDWLNVPYSAIFNTGATYTVEAYVYPTVLNSYNMIFTVSNTNIANFGGWLLWCNSSGTVYFECRPGNGGSNVQVIGGTVQLNQWSHIAVSVNSNAVKLFVNGIQVQTGTIVALDGTQNYVGIGALNNGATASPFTGYISDARLIKGTALYTSNFLPPQAPLTPVANTQLLTVQTNGAANNSMFLDNSTFNNLITKAGDATQGTFSPYSNNGWSTYFNGSTDYLTTPTSTALQLTGDFTVEAWVYLTAINSYNMVFGSNSGTVSDYISIRANTLEISIANANFPAWSYSFNTGIWYHIAVTRSGSSLKAFVNGSQLTLSTGTAADSGQIFQSSGGLLIGRYGGATPYYFPGYISNARIIKGTALYTTNFTPSTTPLTAVANTKLLACQSPGFIDNSPNNLTLTPAGSPSVQPYSYYGSTFTEPTTYSNYFNGSTDYLSVPNNTSLNPGSGNFTVELWAYPLSVVSNCSLYRGHTNGIEIFIDGSNRIAIGYANLSEVMFDPTPWTAGSWYHIVAVRSGTTLSLYKNGTRVATGSDSTTYTTSTANYMGWNGGAIYYNGHLSNVRVVIGTAVYDPTLTSLTVPTSALTAIANTQLLTCQSNRFVDNSNNKSAITVTGSPKILSVNPFGVTGVTNTTSSSYSPTLNGGSTYFDGSGDYLYSSSSSNFGLGTGDFTIEYWIYGKSWSNGPTVIDLRTAGNTNIFSDNYSTSGAPGIYLLSAQFLTSSITIPVNSWAHVAYTRKGSTVNIYVNGVLGATGTNAFDSGSSQPLLVGTNINQSTYYLNGYISDLRITKGVSLYNSNFYPPTRSITASSTIGANTYSSNFLLNSTSGGIIDQSGKVNYESFGDVKVLTDSPYEGTYYSNLFNGSTDYLTLPAGSLDFVHKVAAPWTIEAWFFTSSTAAQTIVATAADTASVGFLLDINDTLAGDIGFTIVRGGGYYKLCLTAGSVWTTGKWNHVAAVHTSGGTITLYVNGVNIPYTLSGSGSASTASATYSPTIGRFQISTTGYSYMNGYISNLRFINGTALYTGNFTPANAPLTISSIGTSGANVAASITGTVPLLTCQSNRFIDNSTNNYSLTASGTPQVKTNNTFKRNTGQSYYFDGTGDYLYSIDNTNLQVAAGDYTIEYWVKPTNFTAVGTHVNMGFLKSNTSTSGAVTVYGGSAGTTLLTTGAAITAGQWTHIAVTRQSGVGTTLWINGTRSGAVAVDSTSYTAAATYIGATSAATNLFIGNIADLRITKGYARYTANNTSYSTGPYLNK